MPVLIIAAKQKALNRIQQQSNAYNVKSAVRVKKPRQQKKPSSQNQLAQQLAALNNLNGMGAGITIPNMSAKDERER